MGPRNQGVAGLPLVALIGLWSGIASAAAPVAYDQTVDIDQGLTITLCGTDADEDPLTYTIETNPSNGMLFGTPPTVDYTPGFDFAGSDSFTFSVDDGTTVSDPATVTITQGGGDVTSGECSGGSGGGGGNSAPVADNQSVDLDEDTSLGITLTAFDQDSDPLTYTVTVDPANGALSGTAPNLTYTPDADFNGSDAFTFVADDGVDSDEATVSITVDPVNDAPEASAQTVQGEANTALDITLAGTDIDGDTLTFSVETGPGNGTLSGTAPDLTYTPDNGFVGDDSFTFTVSDGMATSASATVDITIAAPSSSALINDTGITVCADASVSGLSCTDAGATTDTAGVNPVSGATVPAGQDALYGRDAYANDDSDGVAGFSFTKLDANGDELPDQTVTYGTGAGQAEWACVRDNVTDLVWEVKTDSGLHDTENRYTWFDSNGGENGALVGVPNGGTCSGGSGCDTEAFVADVNANGLCGATDWRLPTRDELIGLVHLGEGGSRLIDMGYFPNASGTRYWTSNRSRLSTTPGAWLIDFDRRFNADGIASQRFLTESNAVRLVRDGG